MTGSDKKALTQAAQVLGIRGKASLKEIRAAYKRHMNEWHPDKCRDGEKASLEMAQKLNHAYDILIEYCEDVPFDFSDEGMESTAGESSTEEFWNEHFGKDPLWGG